MQFGLWLAAAFVSSPIHLFDDEEIHSYNGILIGANTHALLKGLISNDLEWLNEIFNGTKRRAVSLQQLSLLLKTN